MQGLIITVGLFNGLVSFLLLLAANRISSRQAPIPLMVAGAVISGVYAAVCLHPDTRYLGAFHWRVAILICVCLLSFGAHKRGVYASVLFALFQSVIRGFVPGQNSGFVNVLMGMISATVLWILYLRAKRGVVTVELCWQGRKVQLSALQDTGNTLKDPLTGKPVLIIGPKAAEKLTGLQQSQLKDPIKTMTQQPIRGLRLIPYRTINNPGGMLLAMGVDHGKIGIRKGRPVVAFAPEELDREGHIEALIGGTVC